MMDDFEQKLERQRQQHRVEMENTQETLFPENERRRVVMPDLVDLSIDEAIIAYETWAEAAISGEQEAFVARQQPIAPEPSSVNEEILRAELAQKSAAEQLTYVDDIVETLFDIRRIFPDVRHKTDVFFCNTTAAFVQELHAIGLSDAEQSRLIAQAETGDFSGAVLSHVAYYLPDKGCYVNGPLLADGGDPEQAVDEPETFFRAVEAIAQTMWGWGFLIDYSTAGQQRKAAGLWRQEVAAQLGLTELTADYPPVAAQAREYALLLETGWAAWIGQVVTQAARREKLGGWERPSFSNREFWQIMKSTVGEMVSELPFWDMFLPLTGGVKELVSTHEDGQDFVHRQLNRSRTAVLKVEDKVQRLTGHSYVAWLSRAVLDKVESRVGSFCMPYAILIAANVEYDLDAPALDTLPNNPAMFPHGSIDTRLWLLSYLDESVRYDVSSMAIMAMDRLKLASPMELRQA